MADRLARAMEEVGMAYEPAALDRIARAAEGGMRDAWSITDMCLGYAAENEGGLTDKLGPGGAGLGGPRDALCLCR